MNTKKKVIVIGGSGFMGSHLADELSRDGFEVSILDAQKSNWLDAKQTMLIGDILNKEQLTQTFLKVKPAVVYHMAGIADIDECHKDPYKAVNFNILGTTCVLEACIAAGVEKIVFASSAYVSSDMGSFYRITKQASESLIEEYSKKYGIEHVILRYGSLYGPRSDSRNQLYRLVRDALENKKIMYKGSGRERREFIHVLDAARLSVKILSPEFKNQKILITGPRAVELRELLEMLDEMMGGKIDISYAKPTERTHYVLSPYSFKSNIVRKLVGDYHIEFGQGVLSLIEEIDDLKNAA